MFSIGTLSKRTGVKVPTIRYYEQIDLLPPPDRTEGNQRRYSQSQADRLGFIRHARDLGFSLDAIRALIDLHEHPDQSCGEATRIATDQLNDVREKITRLHRLEQELARISTACTANGTNEGLQGAVGAVRSRPMRGRTLARADKMTPRNHTASRYIRYHENYIQNATARIPADVHRASRRALGGRH